VDNPVFPLLSKDLLRANPCGNGASLLWTAARKINPGELAASPKSRRGPDPIFRGAAGGAACSYLSLIFLFKLVVVDKGGTLLWTSGFSPLLPTT
jgi:hypothetical protein